MTFLIILVISLTIWTFLLLYIKKEARSLLFKYGSPLPWIKSNSIIMMIRRLRELERQGIVENDDIGECRFIILTLKCTLIFFPTVMIVTFVISLIIT